MPTDYAGREDQYDLGEGHSFVWLENQAGQVIGLIEHHPKGPDATPGALYCGGYVAWVPEDACRHCPSHGFIRDGRWVSA